jgi:PAS domain S-box-containing protein
VSVLYVAAIMQTDAEDRNMATKKGEAGLPGAQMLHRWIFDQCPIPLAVYDTSMRIVDCNQATAVAFRASREQIIGLHMDDMRDQRHRSALEAAIAGDTVVWESPYRATITDGWFWGSATFVPVRDDTGKVIAVLVLLTDATSQVEPEPMARNAGVRLGEAQRLGRVGSWMYDLRRNHPEASPEFFRIIGVPAKSLAQPRDLEPYVHEEDREPLFAYVEKVLEAKKPFMMAEFRVVLLDGTSRTVVLRGEIKYDVNNEPVSAWGTLQDITERRTLEEQLRRAQRMEGLGQLAGGVAHDFNNLLTVIQVETGLLQEGLSDNDPLMTEVFEIRRAAERAAGLTRQLLAFSRKQILRPRLLDLNVLVSDTSSMLRRLIGEDIELVTMLSLHDAMIVGDPGQLEQVLVNLAVNARDAMPNGGVLRIETTAITAAVGDSLLPPGEHVVLTVDDTGHGMDEAVQRRIFDPFFTTKTAGRGTGLGLSTVFGIVEQSGGRISVDSALGRGARFTIYLPRADPDTPPTEYEAVAAQTFTPVRHATVLLVEDERPVRAVSQRVLEHEGYTVLTAEDGFEALAIAETYSGTIDLLVTDVVLPGLDGRALNARLRERRPGIRVLYMTGYTDDEILRRGVIDDQVALLDKPFNASQLADFVRRVLQGA